MWKLHKSRGTFLNKYNFKDDRSFWWYAAELLAEQAGPNDADELRRMQNDTDRSWMFWKPTNSNCPEISRTVDKLVSSLPQEWTATGKNIFVGIAPLGEINASAWNQDVRGIVEVNLQYLWALEAYVLAFDEFRFVMRDAIGNHLYGTELLAPSPDFGSFFSSWNALDRAKQIWEDDTVIFAGDHTIYRRVAKRNNSEIDNGVASCVSFIIGHELAHHFLTHTSSGGARSRARQAKELVLPLLSPDSESVRWELPIKWVDELEADLVSVALICQKFTQSGDPEDAYRALLGSYIALICANHGQNLSSADPQSDDSTHPPLQTRLTYIGIAVRSWFADHPRGKYNDHPIDLLNQLDAFISLIALHQENEIRSEAESVAAVRQCASTFMQAWEELAATIPLRMDAQVLHPPESEGYKTGISKQG